MNPPKAAGAVNFNPNQVNTMPANGWLWLRGISWSNATATMWITNTTTGVEAHNCVVQSGTAASILMPVRSNDKISALGYDQGFTDIIYRFLYPS